MEHLHFNATCRAKEGERAVILGHPVFLGLNAGNEGGCSNAIRSM
ncbi:MAG: hypothetical protein R2941_16520 [Desulfobacterales bacterium]